MAVDPIPKSTILPVTKMQIVTRKVPYPAHKPPQPETRLPTETHQSPASRTRPNSRFEKGTLVDVFI